MKRFFTKTFLLLALLLPLALVAAVNNEVKIAFNGATKFRENQLRAAIEDQMQVIRESGLTPAAADDAAFFLGIFYRKNGYAHTDVKWEIAGGNQLLLNISEGPPSVVRGVIFTGNQSIPSGRLRDYLLGATRERLSMLKQELPFISADIETGVERVRGLYQSEGFLDSVVGQPEISFSRDGTRAFIKVAVHEGAQYRFGKLSFTGDLVFYPQTELLKELALFSDKPCTPGQVTNMQRKVVYFYRSRGYFDVKVDVESDPAKAQNGLVPVRFNVESGEVYRFDGVSVTGLDRLHPGFLPKRFAKLRGRFYNPAALEEVYREMMRTGLFKSLKITSKPLPTHEVKLDMEVEEAKSKELGFLLGYGTFEGPIFGMQLGDRDLFGTGRPVSAAFEFSARLLKGELTYLDPWFLETPNRLKLRLDSLNQEWQGYSKLETGFRAELSRKLTKKLEATLFWLTRAVQITDQGVDPRELGPTNYLVDSIGTAFTLDLREKTRNPGEPGKGFIAQATGDFGADVGGSAIGLARGTFGASYYLPIKNTLLAFGARGGVISALDGNEIPIDERFFNGGSRSVRSFVERELGPKDSLGNPIGGQTFTTFNIEYVFPIWGDLNGALFTDAGSVGHTVSDGIGGLRYGIGTGLRYKLPIGPLRLDYGFNPSRKTGEAIGAVNFSFGFAF